ncbi:Dol-P-Man:Man(5)GlcNAc(2)-PP-Dol alpha-1,3-mannosyltransferase [Acorus gramineus]|uniref:dolichyl-P-Man:Man5GlcNAc2-PP-dolichol alpha-1,3-mannosyltransferase n=1 Tax=Acorus gramineus TaxID=55184 RepID=A0AAV9BME6_ACOGR|nr:Dol-P-Man:Man(5)GlcNAc(2)-PP-Dol alpha-1,3-mannosyltransferase [Acorus gramineus]
MAAKPKDPLLVLNGYRISKPQFASALLALDAILVALIIAYVPYTKIDWDAYMSQVDGFLGGERDYMKLRGDTGPLVYPAGFLYVYSAVQIITGGEVYPAQILFGVLYLINLGIVLTIYMKTDVWSCFYQDECSSLCPTPTSPHVKGFEYEWSDNCTVRCRIITVGYISRAFNLGRVFMHFWSVNFKFVPEAFFVSKPFAVALLVVHLTLLLMFAHHKWCKLILFFTVEICWNIFPSNLYSSLALLCTHLLILWGLWIAKCEYPYVHSKSQPTKED